MSELSKRAVDLLVLGVHRASPGYPNVLYRLLDLQRSPDFAYREINIPFWQEGLVGSRKPRILTAIFGAVWSHLKLLARYTRAPLPQVLYVPYPAVGVLALLSLLPSRYRPPRVIADVFISAYDTVVNDRRLIDKHNPLALLIRFIEKRACRFADVSIVDTAENASWLSTEFDLPQDRVRAIPLSTDEQNYPPCPYKPHGSPIRVLFVGTLVPLQGITTIIQATSLLRHRRDIRFRFIGDGQDGHHLENTAHQVAGINFDWVREWQPPERIAEEIEQADICLGIFGSTAKAQRVCPFKIYAYARVGRPVITGQTDWLRRVSAESGQAPFAAVPVGDPVALADKIEELADAPALRQRLAENSQHFYAAALSNRIAKQQLVECLLPIRA